MHWFRGFYTYDTNVEYRNSGCVLCLAATHLKSGGVEHEYQRVRELKSLMNGLSSPTKLGGLSDPCALVICGDFNAKPESKVVKLLEQGYAGIEPLQSAYCSVSYTAMDLIAQWCKQSTVESKVVPGFVGVLDYIFISPKVLQICGVLEPPAFSIAQGPPVGVSGACGGIPSTKYPSDHIALACKLRWVTQ